MRTKFETFLKRDQVLKVQTYFGISIIFKNNCEHYLKNKNKISKRDICKFREYIVFIGKNEQILESLTLFENNFLKFQTFSENADIF